MRSFEVVGRYPTTRAQAQMHTGVLRRMRMRIHTTTSRAPPACTGVPHPDGRGRQDSAVFPACSIWKSRSVHGPPYAITGARRVRMSATPWHLSWAWTIVS